MRDQMQRMARAFLNEIGVYRSVVADPRCPRVARWMLGGAVAYALSPVDLIPDFVPVLGHLDDILILPILIWCAVRIIPKELIAEHRHARAEDRGCPLSTPGHFLPAPGKPDVEHLTR